jgi:hypothetical protein
VHQMAALGRRLLGTALALLVVLSALAVSGVAAAATADHAVQGAPAPTPGWGVGIDHHPSTGDALVHAGRGLAGCPNVGGQPGVVPEPPVLVPPTNCVPATTRHAILTRLSDTSTRQERAPPAGIG